jgi:hypothetical protein
MVSPWRQLRPSESLSEIVAALIVVLTFTLAASVVSSGEEGARAALLGAIGCNAAWGIIDAVLYLMTCAFDRNRHLRFARAVASAPDEAAALATIRHELEPALAPVTTSEDRDQLYRSILNSLAHGKLPHRTGLTRDDVVGAIGVVCVALAASLTAVLPLLFFFDQPRLALRVSNLLVVVLLFIVGYHWARYVDANPWTAGFGLMSIGLALVAVAILLGG